MSTCSYCDCDYPHHALGCPHGIERKDGGGGGAAILLAPIVLLAVPFIVIVFPLAGFITIFAAMGINAGVSKGINGPAAFWLTLFMCLPVFLGALLADRWAEQYRLYRIPRHLLRVIGVPWLAAQYFLFLPTLSHNPEAKLHLTTAQFIGKIFTTPGLLVTLIVLLVITQLVSRSFDLNGKRPRSWREFFLPRGGLLDEPWTRVPPADSTLYTGSFGGPRPVAPRAPLTLARKLTISTGVAVAVGIVVTILSKDYDSAILVILRVGVLCAILLGVVVALHHVATRKARLAR